MSQASCFSPLKGNKICYLQICHFGISIILNLSYFRNSKCQKDTLTTFVPRKQEANLRCEAPPGPRRGRVPPGTGELCRQTVLLLRSLVTSGPDPLVLSILHKCLVALSKQHKSCELWSLF